MTTTNNAYTQKMQELKTFIADNRIVIAEEYLAFTRSGKECGSTMSKALNLGNSLVHGFGENLLKQILLEVLCKHTTGDKS